MLQNFDMLIIVLVVMGLVFAGVHIAVALGVTAVLGLYLMLGDFSILTPFVANTAYEALRDYVFAVIPLFMLMGDLLAKCGAAGNIYALTNRVTKWLPARLAVATILSNALIAFVTGVSIAAAAAFSRIAYPEMRRYGYERKFALGSVAGSACLGMLIPPSVLMIIWGVLTEISIGKLFLAGVLPGFLVAGMMVAYCIAVAIIKPQIAGDPQRPRIAASPVGAAVSYDERPQDDRPILPLVLSTGVVLLLILGVLGSIWFGICTPTEGAAVGAVGAFVVASAKGLSLRDAWEVALNVGRTSAPLLLLLFCAQLYSRVLSMSGFTEFAQQMLLATGTGPWGILIVMIAIWFVLGCLIDSTSIILLTVPIFAPIAAHIGFDPIAFAIIGILAVETGLLTPPFGLLVFTVKAAVPDSSVTLSEIFRGSVAYWIILLLAIVAIAILPGIATYLPNLSAPAGQ
jgi:C4-dicarboxylate transporter DctM subunit